MISNHDSETIKQARLNSNAAILKKDVDGVSKYWMQDFIQIAGDGSHTIGKAKIIEDWEFMFSHSSPVFERLPNEIEISQSGEKAWEQGIWLYKVDGFRGKYTAMWRKIKGKWFTQCELYVTLN